MTGTEDSSTGTPYHCRNCGGFVGYILEDGRLRLGRCTTPRASFECDCGAVIVWSVPEFLRDLKDDTCIGGKARRAN